VALLMLGIREHAVTDFQEALKIDPCLADARRNLRIAGVRRQLRMEARAGR